MLADGNFDGLPESRKGPLCDLTGPITFDNFDGQANRGAFSHGAEPNVGDAFRVGEGAYLVVMLVKDVVEDCDGVTGRHIVSESVGVVRDGMDTRKRVAR